MSNQPTPCKMKFSMGVYRWRCETHDSCVGDEDMCPTGMREMIAARDAELAALKAIAERYDILFELYADHIHDHRLGCGEACDQCKQLINAQIDAKVKP
jgi:hypothetical protein